MAATVTCYAFAAKFRCLGAACPDTCCRGWEMPADARQHALYKSRAPELLPIIDTAQGVMQRHVDTQECVALCAGSCRVHTEYGEEFLGDACYFYPRLLHRVGDSYVMSGAPSCPEMLRLMVEEKTPFPPMTQTLARLPQQRRDLVPEGWSVAHVSAVHAAFMAVATDETATPELALRRILAMAEAMSEMGDADAVEEQLHRAAQQSAHTPSEARRGDGHALYYALALTEAFGRPGISHHLAGVMKAMEQALDCQFTRASRAMEFGAQASGAYARLQHRWRVDAQAALAPLLRRWLAAQLAMSFFPFGGFHDITFRERAAVLVQRFATVRLALMCHVSAEGVPPDQAVAMGVVQAIARFMDHLADADLTLMIHRDSGWQTPARLCGLIGE